MKITQMAAIVGVTLLSVAPRSSFAQASVALVEDVTGTSSGVEFMDYVNAGKVIRLGQQGSIVLSYIGSCIREKIKGGTVTVGAEQSEVLSGQIDRTKVACDASKMMGTPQNMSQAAGVIFRGVSRRTVQGDLDPQFTVYGLSPIVQVNGSGVLIIERLDQRDESKDVKLSLGQEQLVRGAFFDFATNGTLLVGGAIYRMTWGTRQVVFKVDPTAKLGRTPIIGRLVRLVP